MSPAGLGDWFGGRPAVVVWLEDVRSTTMFGRLLG